VGLDGGQQVGWDGNGAPAGYGLWLFEDELPVPQVLKVLENGYGRVKEVNVSPAKCAQFPLPNWHHVANKMIARKRSGIAATSWPTSSTVAIGRSSADSFPAPSIRQGLRAISSSATAVLSIVQATDRPWLPWKDAGGQGGFARSGQRQE
jgi:hypothetical protein